MNEIFDMRNIRIGQYVTLACGLGFNVIDTVFANESVGLILSRIDKSQGTRIKKSLSVTPEGFYIGKDQPTMYDIVRVSDEYREGFLTKAGVLDTPVDLYREREMLQGLQCKVKTRNCYWFSISVVNVDLQNKLITLQMESPTTASAPRVNTYHFNGKLQNSETSNFFSPFDIIEVKAV